MNVRTTFNDGVGTLTLCHPPLNILTRAVLGQLRGSLSELAGHPDLRAVVLTAEGKHFSAGADVGEHLPPAFEHLIPEFIETIEALVAFPLPVVAAVRGRCLGGGFELVQAADLIVAGEGAAFGQPEIQLAVSPPAACALLPLRATPGFAAEAVLTGDLIPARRAFDVGLVNHVVPDERVEAEATAIAGRMARHSAAALRTTKRMLRAAEAASRSAALQGARRVYIEDLMQTEDAVEGLRAFLDERTPVWRHR